MFDEAVLVDEAPKKNKEQTKQEESSSNKLINEAEALKENFSSTLDKLIKDIKRQEKIMGRADKRQRREYDELQKRLQEVQKLQLAQKELMDSFIKIIATAIDAKSKYTGGHCSRVPELAMMLALSASKSKEGIFEAFTLETPEQLRELNIAAWLHDCGKVITPEYIVDKATKLETIYNRIHEVRTRFEVIHRDLKIKALERKLAGEDANEVDAWLVNEHAKLQEEFEFIAKTNIGSEFMHPEDMKEVERIAKRTWVRHFDDTIGLAHEEKGRVLKEQSKTPATEQLLSNKERHVIPRDYFDYLDYEKMGFTTPVPENLYNLGEVYNLCINKGTLTQEERFKINEHVMMSIKMLETLPFPEDLKNVPLYAGAHHETLIGTGYPRGLKKEDMPIPARILALADVFEALTAHDRPYKDAKKLSEALKILSFMVKDQHLDKDIFELFLTSGVYKHYADKYLQDDQKCDVDINNYLN